MIYQLFLRIMDFLTNTFGYIGALRIKDILDNLTWSFVLAILLLWVISDIVMHIYRSTTVEDEVAIQEVEFEGVKSLQFNPKSKWGVIESFLGYKLIRLFPTETIRFKTLKPIRVIIFTIMIILLMLGIFLSIWDYFPNGYTPPLKNVGILTGVNDPTIGYPVHSSSIPSYAGYGNK